MTRGPMLDIEPVEVLKGPQSNLMNARIGISATDGTWRTYARGRNITGEYYDNNLLQASDMLTRYAGMPRTCGATFEYNWQLG